MKAITSVCQLTGPGRRLQRALLSLVLVLTCGVLTCGILAAAQTAPDTVRVTLLQVNDVYQIAPVDKGRAGGLARIAALKKKIQAESPHTLLLLAGDTLSPSVASNIFKGEQMVAVWNAAGLDYAALGNHEFDFGDEILLKRMRESKFIWMTANAVDRRTTKPIDGLIPWAIREFDGVKVGFFGVVTAETKTDSKPGADTVFPDPIRTAARIVPLLRARGARVIVAITHLSMAEDKRLAKLVPVDVIIGGHEHEVLQAQAGGTPIFKMGQDAKLLGRIDLHIAKRTGKLESLDFTAIPVNEKVADDPAVAAVIAGYEQKLSAELDKAVGRAGVELEARSSVTRSRETNMANFIADAYRRACNADVAMVNGGAIRANAVFPAGPLTRRDILALLPFEDPIVKAQVSGAKIRAALEHGVSRIVEEPEAGRFPQVSGLEFTFDGRRPVGSRVTEIKIGGQPLDDRKTYTLAAGFFLMNGGDGYGVLKGSKLLVEPENAKVDAVILEEAIAAAGEITPKIENRIKRLDQ
ncbi:MAG: bifunctional metallophosphatase/5'-nucleotidase [Blastocatellia bacterium]